MQKILVIEDNVELRENTAELLELNHYSVITAENGAEGFRMAKEMQPDLVLCDIMMPETDGRKFLLLAKDDPSVRHIPIIFFSAGTSPEEIRQELIRVSDGYLKKPFSEQELLERIQVVMKNS